MIVIGLVGESGTGKTTIAAHLERKGAAHINADEVAHWVLAENHRVVRRIREEWGEKVFCGETVDRKKLGKLVFEDSRALATLNRIIHPPVLESCRRQIEVHREEGCPIVVVDAALLLDVDLPFELDLVVALRAGRDEQVRRLLAKEGLNREDIVARLENQSDLEKSFYRADVVLDTNKPLVLVLEQIDDLVDRLLEREKYDG